MKIECSIEKLKNSIIQSERITGKNLTLPILSSILLIASGKKFKIRSTNLSLGIEINIPAKVESDGVVAVKGDILNGLFATMNSSGTVVLEVIGDILNIETKHTKSSIKCMPTEDFPTIPIIEADCISLPIKQIISGFKSVFYATSISDIKPEIASVYMYYDGENMVFVGTDSFRLAEKKIKMNNIENFQSVLIPFKNVIEIMRLFQDQVGNIEYRITKTQISFTDIENGVYITSRIIDGNFPDYRQIFPKENTTEMTVLKQDLQQALKISNVFTDKFNQITLNVIPKTKSCIITSKNSDIGENNTTLDVKINGEEITASFNFKYFIDCFQSINQESVVIYFTTPNKPIIIQGLGDNSFSYLIMPLNR